MHLEQHYDGARGEDADRLVVESWKEEVEAEILFMIGAGVRCQRIARDYSDPLQAPRKEYPITFSAESTTTIFNGLNKVIDGPKAGYFGLKPANARSTLESLTGVSADLSFHGLKAFLAESEA